MPRNPWTYGYRTPRRPRRLTWYTVITQIFTLIGRLVGRAATSRTGIAGGKPPRSSSRRRT